MTIFSVVLCFLYFKLSIAELSIVEVRPKIYQIQNILLDTIFATETLGTEILLYLKHVLTVLKLCDFY